MENERVENVFEEVVVKSEEPIHIDDSEDSERALTNPKGKVLGIAALVLAILSVLGILFILPAFLFGIGSVVLGIICLTKKQQKVLAIISLVIAVLAMAFTGVMTAAFYNKVTSEIAVSSHVTPEGFVSIGGTDTGYVDVPEDFVPFQDVNASNSAVKQYSKPDQSMIVSMTPIDRTDVELSQLAALATEQMSSSGANAVMAPEKVAGYEGYNIYQRWPDEDLTLHAYVIQAGSRFYFITVEYKGDQEVLGDQVIESFRP